MNGQTPGQAQGRPGNARPGRDPNAILDDCREVDRGIDSIEQSLGRLRSAQQQYLQDPDTRQNSSTSRRLEEITTETMALYRNLTARVKAIKSQPESGSPKNAPQVGKVDRRLKAAINQFQTAERDFRKSMQVQQERAYRIVRPDATDEEVKEAVEDTSNTQVFSQAVCAKLFAWRTTTDQLYLAYARRPTRPIAKRVEPS